MLVYFSLGTLLLPQGDFSTLPDIPKMYAHCKATEDADLDMIDFVTEHLFQMDDLMGEAPDPGDRPHAPVQFHHLYSPVTIVVRQISVEQKQPLTIEKKVLPIKDDKYLSDYPASVFRPPIV